MNAMPSRQALRDREREKDEADEKDADAWPHPLHLRPDVATTPFVLARLREAGMSLMALRGTAGPRGFGCNMPAVVHDFWEAYGQQPAPLRAPIPHAKQISRMEECWTWLNLIPAEVARRGEAELVSLHGGVQLRRIVAARMLHHPVTERPLLSWRQIGVKLHYSHEAVRGWHKVGVGLIVKGLG